jgi:hypothetical protein
MSRFQSVVATTSALLTIAVTSVTAYKVFGNQQENSQKQQIIIEDLKQQLEAKKPEVAPVVQQPITPPVQVVQQPLTPPPPVVPPAPELPIQQ